MRDGGDENSTQLMDTYGELDELARKLSGAIVSVRFTYKTSEQLDTLASNITQIRHLLQALVSCNDQGSNIGKALLSRYLDLEGQVKQIRNDLELASRSNKVRR